MHITRSIALLSLAVLATSVLGSGAAVAQAPGQVTASPSTVAVGEVATITASGFGDLPTAPFGLSDVSGVAQLSADGTTYGTTAEASVEADGTATVYFKATAPGSYVVDATNGETPIGETTVTVTAATESAPSVTAAPSTFAAGESTTITASNLGGLQTVGFGLGGDSVGTSFDPGEAAVSDGTAETTFSASEPGTYVIDISDGETSLAQVSVTVTAAAPTEVPQTPTATPQPAPSETGISSAVIWAIVVALLVLIAAVVAIIVIMRRRRSTGPRSGRNAR